MVSQNYELVQVGSSLQGGVSWEKSGWSVAISSGSNARFLVVGSPYYNSGNVTDCGRALLYTESQGSWTYVRTSYGSTNKELCGYSVAINSDGTRYAVGCPFYSSSGSNKVGRVIVVDLSGGVGTERTIVGLQTNGYMGNCVSLSSSGLLLAVSQYGYNYLHTNTGRVTVYNVSSTGFTQIGEPLYGTQANEKLGYRVSVSDGNLVATLSYGYNATNSSIETGGKISVYSYSSEWGWMQFGQSFYGNVTNEFTQVSLSGKLGDTLAIGSPRWDVGSSANVGRVRVFQKGPTS